MTHENCDPSCPHDDPGELRCHCICKDCGGETQCTCEYCKLINPAPMEAQDEVA